MAVRKRLTKKRYKLLNDVIEGTNDIDNPSNYYTERCHYDAVEQLYNNMDVGYALRSALLDAGIDLPRLANKLNDKLDAKKLIYTTSHGMITDSRDIDDNEIQLKALSIIGRWLGLDDKHVEVHHHKDGDIDMSKLSDEELDEIINVTNAVDVEYNEMK